MRVALHALQTTDRSITEIAFDAGYEYAGNFATAFRRTFGFAPRTVRGQAAGSERWPTDLPVSGSRIAQS